MSRIHQGRKKDSWQVPHKNRRRYLVKFHMPDGMYFGSIVAVPEPVHANLRKYRSEIIAANFDKKFVRVTAEFLGVDA